ncbi:amidase signature enzyme [Aureobasidium pullulans]|nr:amidase signature enzyme [Aureobasidium pullulans]
MSSSSVSIVEAPISLLQSLLSTGAITSTELCALYLHRISTYDARGVFLNSVPLLHPNLFAEAAASDARRASGKLLSKLDGIPYTLKDGFKYLGMSVAAGSPAFANLRPNENAFVADKLAQAGCVMIGKTNMPPMAAGGMQRGVYGRAESPYNMEYLTAAFSSGSSNGAATSTAASFAAFGLGSETVSSGRSPASNNGLVCYTPSRGVISSRGLWPLYVTCDVVVPLTRTVEDMLAVLEFITQPDFGTIGDFWRDQRVVTLPKTSNIEVDLSRLCDAHSLRGKRLAIPKMYTEGTSDTSNFKAPFVSEDVKKVWAQAQSDLTSLGAICVEVDDFPLVTRYEDDSTGQHNNVAGAPADWNLKERSDIISYAWDDFLLQNQDPRLASLGDASPDLIFPLPEDYLPLRFAEVKNLIDYPALAHFIREGHREGRTIHDIPGMSDALKALEAQRKRDLEDWMTEHDFDAVVFPAIGDVGKADLEQNSASAEHALLNGVRYSNGNRALRHLGVPTVSVPMGILEGKDMPVNLTLCSRAGADAELLSHAYAYEQSSKWRQPPGLTPSLLTDHVKRVEGPSKSPVCPSQISLKVLEQNVDTTGSSPTIEVRGTVSPSNVALEASIDGVSVDRKFIRMDSNGHWVLEAPFSSFESGQYTYKIHKDVKILADSVMIVLLARSSDGAVNGEVVLIAPETSSQPCNTP